jgi:hypothetical protein
VSYVRRFPDTNHGPGRPGQASNPGVQRSGNEGLAGG